MEFEHVQYPLLWIDVCERTIYLQSAFSNPICGIERKADVAALHEHSTRNSMGLQMPVFNAPHHPEVPKQFGFPNGMTSKIQTGTYMHDKQYEEQASRASRYRLGKERLMTIVSLAGRGVRIAVEEQSLIRHLPAQRYVQRLPILLLPTQAGRVQTGP